MIYFITDSNPDIYSHFSSDINIISSSAGINYIYQYLKQASNTINYYENGNFVYEKPVIYLDTEDNGLDPYKNDVLLTIIGDENNQYVIDSTTVNPELIKQCFKEYEDYVVLGHNISYDYKMLKANYDLEFKHLYDTMIADQRITQGVSYNGKLPIKGYYALDTIVSRYLKIYPTYMDKNIREGFIGMKAQNAIFTETQIKYAAGDIQFLPQLHNKLENIIANYEMSFLVYNIEFPLIKILADLELEGIYIDEDAWIEMYQTNINRKKELSILLDEEIEYLRDNVIDEDRRHLLIGGKFSRPRNTEIEEPVSNNTLFGELEFSKKTQDAQKRKINQAKKAKVDYNSSTQIVELFARMGIVCPTKKGNYVIPKLDNRGKLITRSTEDNYTVGEEALELYLNQYPDTPLRKFIKYVIEYNKLGTAINTFGKNFLEKNKNPITGKYHTKYRQCGAKNGRFQSGGGKEKDNDKFNSQNIPAKPEYRKPFHAGTYIWEGEEKKYSVATIDLTGAEVTILTDKSRDEVLYELAIVQDDVHSPIITQCWRNIFHYRAKQVSIKLEDTTNKEIRDKYQKEFDILFDKAQHYEVSKKVNVDVRKNGKNSTFGTIYGAGAKRIAKTINISIIEGKIYVDTIKNKLKKAFEYTDKASKIALETGKLKIDDRTNATIFFKEIFLSKQGQYLLSDYEIAEIDGIARNVTISGTQANMIKEAIVEIQKIIDELQLDCALLLQVHDELVYRCPKHLDGISVEWMKNSRNGICFEFDNPIDFEEFEHLSEKTKSHYYRINLEKNKEYNKVYSCIVSFPEFARLTMIQVANRYLSYVKMSADMDVKDHWTK